MKLPQQPRGTESEQRSFQCEWLEERTYLAPITGVYSSSDVPKPIPDGSTVVSRILVPETFQITDINVRLSIIHTWDADVDAFLEHGGISVELFTDLGGSRNNFSGTTLDDEARKPITLGRAPFRKTYRPEGFLRAFDGMDIQGVWELRLTDDLLTDTGSLISWSIRSEGTQSVNRPPLLDDVTNKSVNEGEPLNVQAHGSDPDGNAVSYFLGTGAPAGATINPTTGLFSWTPSEQQGPGNYSVTIGVRDNGIPSLSDTSTLSITVGETNSPPVFIPIGSKTVDEGNALTFTAIATDPDRPANSLTYTIDPGAPAGAVINPTTGVFTWTPTEDQGPGTYNITIRVTDNGSPSQSDSLTTSIVVTDQSVDVHNSTVTTQCAEVDNVNLPMTASGGALTSFVIEARHPTYQFDQDNGEPNFLNCDPPSGPTFDFTPLTTSIYDDGTIAIVAKREAQWWQPTGMMAIGSQTVGDIHLLQVHHKIAGVNSWPEVLVIYADGNVRIKPHAPVGRSDVLFGSSVIIGPATPSMRPHADISSVRFQPATKTFEITYRGGGSAVLKLETINRDVARFHVTVNFPTPSNVAFATVRSMYVANGNSDMDYVTWRDDLGVFHEEPILAFSGADVSELLAWRKYTSIHNTSASDYWVGDFQFSS